MSDKTDLGDRMKRYENIPRIHLTPRMPCIIRADGKAFHTYTKGFKRPWDESIRNAMSEAACALVEDIQGAEFAYYQSDEISVLLNDYKRFTSQSWFDKSVQKMVSVAASIATAAFNRAMWKDPLAPSVNKMAYFDARVFVLPREEVNNYFWWRQMDAIRNSVSGLAQANFSHKELQGCSVNKMLGMLERKGISWEKCEDWQKYGMMVTHDEDVGPMRSIMTGGPARFKFKDNPEFINRFLTQVEE